jgi:hypothetical protein
MCPVCQMDLQCPNLVELRLSADGQKPTGCGNLRKIILHSRSMQEISWRGFPSLETVILECPALQRCDLSECDSLANTVLQTFAYGQGATNYQSGCQRLE